MVVPDAVSGTSICSAWPLRLGRTVPKAGVDVGLTVRTSPSWSESLLVTGRLVVRPGRTPNLSFSTVGGWFSCWRSGSLRCVVRSVLSSCSSLSTWLLLLTSFQSLTRTMSLSGSQTLPVAASLSTMTLRLVRNSADLLSASFSLARDSSSLLPGQSRRERPVPVHAA